MNVLKIFVIKKVENIVTMLCETNVVVCLLIIVSSSS